MDRERAWKLLCEYTESESLRKHGLAVEAVMRHFARKRGEDEESWGIVGLLHDFDYERFPEEHPQRGESILREQRLADAAVQAIQSHAHHTGVPRDTPLAQTLFAVDELAGFIIACALVRPDKSLHNVKVSSVRKKLKDKAFARAVSRDDIRQGAEDLGLPLEELIAETLDGMRAAADELGLGGAS
jgi:predicted hydrolase (HD superfamily)